MQGIEAGLPLKRRQSTKETHFRAYKKKRTNGSQENLRGAWGHRGAPLGEFWALLNMHFSS